MLRLAHLSDLHFGAADPEAIEALGDAVDGAAPDAVVVTGDITQAGRRREFEEAGRFFETLKSPLLIIPGNHDVPVYSLHMRFFDPWRRFREAFASDTDRVMRCDGAVIVGLNSARRAGPTLDWSLGRLSSSQIDLARRAFREAPEDARRVVALHHPVTKGPGRAGSAVVGAAPRALGAFAEEGTDLILSGHVHIADADVIEINGRSIVSARAGTASSHRVRGEAPSFNIIEMGTERLDIRTLSFASSGYEKTAERNFDALDRGWARRMEGP